MRRTSILLVAVVLGGALTSAPAEGARPKVRKASEAYTATQAVMLGFNPLPEGYVGDCDPTTDQACVRFEIGPKERYFTLEVKDVTGLPVYAAVFAPDGSDVVDVCGRTDEPVAAPGGYVDVWLTSGNCYGTQTPSVPTTGTVEASFSVSASAL